MTKPESRSRVAPNKIGLALAGGGPAGAIYEIGALRALDEAVGGIDFNSLQVYVGVSAGAFICANLANNITPTQMCRAIVKHEAGEHPFVPDTFYALATGEILRRAASVPRLFGMGLWSFLKDPLDKGLIGSMMLMGRALPTGVFDNRHLGEYLERIFTLKDRTNDFRELQRNLIIVAADLDSGQAVRFGHDGLDHIPISLAVQASTALPGVYAPVKIEGRHYVDGVLLKTMHGSVALEEGAELLLCLNPLVPVDTVEAVNEGVMRRGKLIDRGLPTVLSQSMRTMIRSRLGAGLSAYHDRFPGADVILFEPPADDYEMFFTNVFSFSSRRMVCEHAYASTRQQLLERYEELEPLFSRHGLTLKLDVLEHDERDLWDGVGLGRYEHRPGVLNDLDALLDRLEDRLAEIA